MNNTVKLGVTLTLGAALGAGAVLLLNDNLHKEVSAAATPLYWVAPMDANYRRDEPGQSPMGMDLVPVYSNQEDNGTVLISPAVVNNLGVRSAEVSLGNLETRVNTVGYVQYDEDRLVHLHPRVAGWIETLYVKAAGDSVSEAAPLFTLYSPELVTAQEELLLALKRGNVDLIAAAADRLLALDVSVQDIQRLRDTGDISRTITTYAPQAGVVDHLDAREGMFVEPGMEVLSLVNLESIWIIAEVFERQAMLVHEGDTVTARLDYLPGRQWPGRVDYVYPTLDPKMRTSRLRIRLDNADGALHPGMFAQIEISTQPAEPRLLVPSEALIRTGTQSRVVLALGDGRFRSAVVKPGRIGNSFAEILAGLREGDRVVTSAQFLIDSESSRTADLERLNAEPAAMDHSQHKELDHHSMNPEDMNTDPISHDGMDHGLMNHEDINADSMSHENMDHGSMNHERMDQDSMDHDGMNHSLHETSSTESNASGEVPK